MGKICTEQVVRQIYDQHYAQIDQKISDEELVAKIEFRTFASDLRAGELARDPRTHRVWWDVLVSQGYITIPGTAKPYTIGHLQTAKFLRLSECTFPTEVHAHTRTHT